MVGRWIARQAMRHALLYGALVVTATAAVYGASVYLDHGKEVAPGRALIGAAIAAALLGMLPPALFIRWGFRIESKRALGLFWLVAVVPLAIYMFVVTLEVEKYSICAPHAYECPI